MTDWNRQLLLDDGFWQVGRDAPDPSIPYLPLETPAIVAAAVTPTLESTAPILEFFAGLS